MEINSWCERYLFLFLLFGFLLGRLLGRSSKSCRSSSATAIAVVTGRRNHIVDRGRT